MHFVEDLANGKAREKYIGEIISAAGFSYEENNDSDYDLKFRASKRSKPFTVEVKFDKMSEKTGNIAIEYYNPKAGKDSGIASSKADIWVYVLPDQSAWAVNLLELQCYVLENKPIKNVKLGGDKNASLYLYKKDILEILFVRLDNLSGDGLKSAIKKLRKNSNATEGAK